MNLNKLLTAYPALIDPKELKKCSKSSRAGNTSATTRLAVCQALGLGVRVNKAAASRKRKKMANLGYATALPLWGTPKFRGFC